MTKTVAEVGREMLKELPTGREVFYPNTREEQERAQKSSVPQVAAEFIRACYGNTSDE